MSPVNFSPDIRLLTARAMNWKTFPELPIEIKKILAQIYYNNYIIH